ncbi:MAG TPA: hypothetical protein VJC06_03650 [Candidatus Paceibacterota bacterium]
MTICRLKSLLEEFLSTKNIYQPYQKTASADILRASMAEESKTTGSSKDEREGEVEKDLRH